MEPPVLPHSQSEHTIQEDRKGGYSFLFYQSILRLEEWVLFSSLPGILYKKIGKVGIPFFSTTAYFTGRLERYLLCQRIQYKTIRKERKVFFSYLPVNTIQEDGKVGILFFSTRAY